MPLMRCTEEAFIVAIKIRVKNFNDFLVCKKKKKVSDEALQALNDTMYITRDMKSSSSDFEVNDGEEQK